MDENPYDPPEKLVEYKPVDWKRVAIRTAILLVAGYFTIGFAISAFVSIIGEAHPVAAITLGSASIGIATAKFYWVTRP